MGDKLRFVGTVDGAIVIDEMLGPCDDVIAISAEHKQKLEGLAGFHLTWVMEISDPDGDIAPLRFSNDPGQLVIPTVLTDETLGQAIEERRPGGNGA